MPPASLTSVAYYAIAHVSMLYCHPALFNIYIKHYWKGHTENVSLTNFVHQLSIIQNYAFLNTQNQCKQTF